MPDQIGNYYSKQSQILKVLLKSIYRMSLLIRQCKFNNYWRHTKFTNLRKIRELCVSSSNNLNISKHSCNIHATPDVPNDKIKRCLDYITNEYKNNTKISSILLDFIDLNTTSNLLKERIQLIENINSLQDLGKLHTSDTQTH